MPYSVRALLVPFATKPRLLGGQVRVRTGSGSVATVLFREALLVTDYCCIALLVRLSIRARLLGSRARASMGSLSLVTGLFRGPFR